MIAVLAAIFGCSEAPVPPEIQLAQIQQQDLWRAGASIYAPEDYAAYQQALESGRDLLNHELGRFVWLRDDNQLVAKFTLVLSQGEALLRQCETIKKNEKLAVQERFSKLELVLRLLRETAGTLKDGRLAGQRLAIVEVELGEARRLIESDQWREAEPSLDRAAKELTEKIKRFKPLFGRYGESEQLKRWREVAEVTVAESRTGRSELAIVVSKLDKRLVLYSAGREVGRYPVTFGYNYLSDKLSAGDNATPEGRYRVQAKNPGSRYHKALLLDYPNSEDRRRYVLAKKSGQIKSGTGIGGLIEIHGGGLTGLTEGCVALENQAMDELFKKVSVGTPVAIVGTLDEANLLARTLAGLQ